MTQNIVIAVSGDCWNNVDEVKTQLDQISNTDNLTIDLRSEGPSLTFLGVTDVIDQWLVANKRSPHTVTVTRWSNPVEWVPYQLSHCNPNSHFFPMSVDYWLAQPARANIMSESVKLFGLFVGRLSIPRSVILYEACTQYHHHAVFSKMSSREMMPWDTDYSQRRIKDSYEQWFPLVEFMRMVRWFESSCPSSVDGLSVQDQFVTPTSYINTNSNLLKHYANFAIELVAETYCQGQTFFPTEKTVRPLMACKPMIVYGPRCYLARLRSIGFQTWHSLWDESYDLLEGPARWHAIKKTMNGLVIAGTQQRQDTLARAHEICVHNRQKLVELISKTRTVEPWMTQHDSQTV